MEYEFTHGPAYTVVRAELDAREEVVVETGSMISFDESIEVETASASGGMLSSVKDSVLGDEELFRNTFRATANAQVVRFACDRPGDMAALDLEDETVAVRSGAYVGNGPGVETGVTSGGLDSLRGGKGLFLLEASGTGPLFLGGYGAIEELRLGPGERVTVDSGHAIAWDDSVEFRTHRLGGLKQKALGGEGRVVTFSGPGRLLIQTRDPTGDG